MLNYAPPQLMRNARIRSVYLNISTSQRKCHFVKFIIIEIGREIIYNIEKYRYGLCAGETGNEARKVKK